MREKLRNWYETYIGKAIPRYALFSVIFCFVFNSVVYSGTQFLMKDAKHFDLTTKFDRSVPFITEWVLVYVICFAFWGVNYIIIARQGREEWFKFAAGDYLSRVICLIFFVLLPTTNVRPEVVGDGFTDNLMRFIYSVDPAANLFPSIHCLVSWLCFAGIRGRKNIPLWYRAFSCIFAIMVFVSTQLTKQHYIADVIAGVIIAELCLYIGRHTGYYKRIREVFGKLDTKIFGDICYDEEDEQEYF